MIKLSICAELMVKFGELCECSMSLRCKLPTEDLDLLVSVTCDEDLVAVIDEYDRASSSSSINDVKIRAVLVPIKSSLKKSSSVPSFNCSKSKSYPPTLAGSNLFVHPRVDSFSNPVVVQKNARKALSYSSLSELDRNHSYLVRHGSYWQLNNYIVKEHK